MDMEMEGFLSTTLSPTMASAFVVNVLMEIIIPVVNLKATFDHGFANIADFSEHLIEKEVLVNAFNVFKILGVKKPVVN